MFGITNVYAYVIGVIAIVLLPGPNSLFCLTIAGQRGVKIAYQSVAGVFVGDSILMLLTALGAASVLNTFPLLFWLLKIGGGLYLAYIGLGLLCAAIIKWKSSKTDLFTEVVQEASATNTDNVPKKVFQRALTLSLLNPKAILFFLSFFVQFVDVHYPYPALSFLILALILQVVSMAYLSILVFGGASLVSWFGRYRRMAAMGMGAIGAMFMGFAVKLWTATT
ncbi:leucine efflux protein LeuE [Stenoxybacter acetivorans]|uniref:leucine efflux protein LeuE n=1 Tax=Stenoxybacter acetivorans TaxID=422441 RepID=UPI0005638D11|nr:leucine efflux protein LeuE [Stenoxybacter acetivorans]